ncbi:MAG: ketosteroid isomerase-like protein [Sulfurimonas sp.]|jgi:ketosteroid isomerase-like protein
MTHRSFLKKAGLFCISLPIAGSMLTGCSAANSADAINIDGSMSKQYKENTKEEIKGLIEKYTKSINTADIDLGKQMWLDSEETSFIHPRGHDVGTKNILENFYTKVMFGNFSKRDLQTKNIHISVYRDSAVVEFYWDFYATFKKDGSAIETHGRESQIYSKTAQGEWKLVHVHYSNMPVRGSRAGF